MSTSSLVKETKPAASIPGGKAQGRSPSEFDPKQLKKGIAIEHEHTPSSRRAVEIAMDHLTEFDNYYKKLPGFERTLKKAASFLKTPGMNYPVSDAILRHVPGARKALIRNKFGRNNVLPFMRIADEIGQGAVGAGRDLIRGVGRGLAHNAGRIMAAVR